MVMYFTGKIIITLVKWKIVGFRQGLEGVEFFNLVQDRKENISIFTGV